MGGGKSKLALQPAHDGPLWAIRFSVPERFSDYVADALAEEVAAVSSLVNEDTGTATIELIVNYEPQQPIWEARLRVVFGIMEAEAPAITIQQIPQKDWLREVQKSFVPIRAGRFYVHGTHIGDVPEDVVPICVDAGLAFGSGEHGTTKGCLEAIDALAEHLPKKRAALDLGTGSGILAMALAKASKSRVIASDIDPVAVKVAKDNAKLNEVQRRITFLESDGVQHDLIRKHAPYGLIVANILARPLVEMAGDIAALLHPEGALVLSGLLTRQRAEVLPAYEDLGLRLKEARNIGEWSTLVLAH